MHPSDKKFAIGILLGILALILLSFIGELETAIALRLSYGFLSSVMVLDVFHLVKTRGRWCWRWRWKKVVVIWIMGVTLFVCQFFFGNELIQNLSLDFLMGLQEPFLYLFGDIIADTAFRLMALVLGVVSLIEFVMSACVPRNFFNF